MQCDLLIWMKRAAHTGFELYLCNDDSFCFRGCATYAKPSNLPIFPL